MSNIAENIRRIRTALGYSQDFVANKMHMSQQTYSLLERNPEEASLSRLRDLAGVLQVEFLALIGEDETFVQTNLHQSGGNAATKMVVNEQAGSEEFIRHLQSEIEYLRQENQQLLKKVKS
jgi:transcriptional regulator with XRE-family HTH domain